MAYKGISKSNGRVRFFVDPISVGVTRDVDGRIALFKAHGADSVIDLRTGEVFLTSDTPMTWTIETTTTPHTYAFGIGGTVNEDVMVDWGDGSAIEVFSSNGRKTHSYATPGTYNVSIVSADVTYIQLYDAIGSTHLLITAFSTAGADLGITSTESMFRECTNIASWGSPFINTASIITFDSMFKDNTAFNEDISGWSTGSCLNFTSMFDGATAFDQDLSGWDVTSLIDASSMFDNGAGLSTDNYNALLIGWEAQDVQDDVTLDAGDSYYGLSAESARAALIADHNWTINDQGLEIPLPSYSTVYAVAGNDGSSELIDNDAFNGSSWSSDTSLPSPIRQAPAAATIGSNMYAFGGYVSSTTSNLTDNDAFNGSSWSADVDLPSPGRRSHSGCEIGTALHCLFGYTGVYLRDNDKFDTSSWSADTNGPTPGRYNFGCARLNYTIYAYYGHSSGGRMRDCDSFDRSSWSSLTSGPLPTRNGVVGSTIGSKVYSYGGYSPSLLTTVEGFDGSSWSSETSMPAPGRSNCAASTIGTSTAYVYTGWDGTRIRDCDSFDGSSWTNEQDIPSPGRNSVYGSGL